MLDPQRAVVLSLALMSRGSLPVVAVHAVVVDAAAVVGRDIATEVALVLDVGLLVLVAESDAVLVVLVLVEKLAPRTLIVECVVIVHV